MAITLNSFTPNTKAESAKVNTNFSNLKSGVEEAAYRAFSWGLIGGVPILDTQGMQWPSPQALTVKKLWAKTSSGTCTIRIKDDATNIHAGFDVTSTLGNTTTFASSAITAGSMVTLDVTASSSGVDLFVVLECQVSSIA